MKIKIEGKYQKRKDGDRYVKDAQNLCWLRRRNEGSMQGMTSAKPPLLEDTV